MDEGKLFDAFYDLPDGYQVQLMVLQEYPAGLGGREEAPVFRSRLWIGTAAEPEPLLHRNQEYRDARLAIDGCFSMLLAAAAGVVDSPLALEAVRQLAHKHFVGVST
jgi:hypothetical protein